MSKSSGGETENVYRVVNLIAGVLLLWSVTLQHESSNVCVWRVLFGLNSLVAILISIRPSLTGKNFWNRYRTVSPFGLPDIRPVLYTTPTPFLTGNQIHSLIDEFLNDG